jgi:alpha-L-arabinofuranosidase
MANIAQTVNVLQAMILTDKEKMLRTPTYWVFEMFKGHQGGTVIPAEVNAPDYKSGDKALPALSASATRDKSGNILVSLVNCDPGKALAVELATGSPATATVNGRILTADTMHAHNTFGAPDALKPETFAAFKAGAGKLTVTLPAKSIVTLEIR